MTDEEALFETWWALHRLKAWRVNNLDRGPEPTPEFMLGFKADCYVGWMARARLHVSRAGDNG